MLLVKNITYIYDHWPFTRFIFYKNPVYKNVEAQKCSFFKNIVVILLVAISISFEPQDKIYTLIFFVSTRFISTLGSVSLKNKHIAKHALRLRFGGNFSLFTLFLSFFPKKMIFPIFLWWKCHFLTVFFITTMMLAVRVISF